MKRFVLALFSGMLLLNAIPHLVKGICGDTHMTPFAVNSAALVNVVWAWINLIAGGLLLKSSEPKSWTSSLWAAFCLGGIVISIWLGIFWSNPDARLPWH